MIQVSKKYYYFIHVTLLVLVLLVIGLSSVIGIGYTRYENFINFLFQMDSREAKKLIDSTNEIKKLTDSNSNEIKKLSQQVKELNDSMNKNKMANSNERKLLRGLLNEMIKVMDSYEK